MKKTLLHFTFVGLLAGINFTANAQTLFLEDFETSPVTSFLNSGETSLSEGPSPCVKASRGNASDFNSTNINFNVLQNSSYYLGLNPESPCSGYYIADLTSGPHDFSGQDSLRFSCRYYRTSTLGWGGPGVLHVIFSNASKTLKELDISDVFTFTDEWMSVDVALPSTLIDPAITIELSQIGGGEGVAMDDIEIYNVSTVTSVKENDLAGLKIYPNPFMNNFTVFAGEGFSELSVFNVLGELVYRENVSSQQKVSTEKWDAGLYFYQLKQGQNVTAVGKMLKN